jgi:LysM domain-containing protein
VEDVEDGAVAGGRRATSVAGPFRSGRGLDPSIIQPSCRFLLREAEDGALDPGRAIDPANRCVAMVEPVPQSSRQQELVCLTAAHINCPRYLRGLLLAGAEAPKPVREPISPAVIGASIVLAAALAASFGFLAVRGGFDLPLRTPQPSLVAVAPNGSPSPSPNATPSPVIPASASPSPSPSPEPTARPTTTPAPTSVVTPAPTPTRTATPAPSSDRYALLTPCPTTTDCWIYVIRSGDNLQSIANYFGVSYERVLDMNPDLGDPGNVRPGYRLRIPTPTR